VEASINAWEAQRGGEGDRECAQSSFFARVFERVFERVFDREFESWESSTGPLSYARLTRSGPF